MGMSVGDCLVVGNESGGDERVGREAGKPDELAQGELSGGRKLEVGE